MPGRVVILRAAVLLAVGASTALTTPDPPHPRGDSSGAALQKYIVVFKNRVSDPRGLANRLARQHGGSTRFVYEHAIKGFAATLPARAASALSQNPNVAYIEPDRRALVFTEQEDPPNWGLDRIDQADLPLDDVFFYGNDASGIDGSGINIYVIDSGVRKTHHDFGGRVEYVPSSNNGNFVGDGRGNAEDCYGHGTHVAGIAASATYGVAKGATVWAARVLDCAGNGDASMALAAVDWITANGQLPAVVNMSLGYPDVVSLRDAVMNSIAAGFSYVVAAGNQAAPADACTITPANAPAALTVGATDANDNEGSWSNYGTCVDMLAPGVDILSTAYSSNSAKEKRSGTSSAAPHVAGAAALLLCANPDATPAELAAVLTANAAPDRINLHNQSHGVTPNRLLYMAFIGACDAPTPNLPPIVSSAIPDTTVNEDSPSIAAYRDLNDVFTDAEDGSALTFLLVSNSNPNLVDAVISGADSTVGLTFAADQHGSATIVLRATDSGLLYVEDTLRVSVSSVNDPPTVVGDIPDTTVVEDNPAIDNYRDLNNVFRDVEDGAALDFNIQDNTNTALVTAVVDADSALDLVFAPSRSGSATIVLRGTDSGGLWVDETLVVTVTSVNDPPTVTSALPDTTIAEDNPVIESYRDLNNVFVDIEDGRALSYTVQDNTNPALLTAVIDADSALQLTVAPNGNGAATVVVRATDSGGLWVDEGLVVTVTPVNDPPVVAVALPDTAVEANSPPIHAFRDLNTVFRDIEDGRTLSFAIESNDNPTLVTAEVGQADSTLELSFASDRTGEAKLVIRATDSGMLSVDDTLVVAVVAAQQLPTQFALHQNAPNPFKPPTTIRADIARAGRVELRIFDVSGRVVRTLVTRELPRARHEFEWDGRDNLGRPVPSGVYFYKLMTSEFTSTRKMVFLK